MSGLVMQRTLQEEITVAGIGLHSGMHATITLSPSEEDSGIVFCRNTDAGMYCMPARADMVSATGYATVLGEGVHAFSTIEHLLSAIYGLGIDNVSILLTGDEIPIADGSAAPFVFAIEQAGIRSQNAPKRFIRIARSVCVADDDKRAEIHPYEGFAVDFEINFAHSFVDSTEQTVSIDFSPGTDVYCKQIAYARTFGFVRDKAWLAANNLAQGGSTDTAVIIDATGVVNKEGIRCKAEFVKHKVLDAVGDLSLAGAQLLGRYVGVLSGHTLNNRLIRAVLADTNNYEYVTFSHTSCPIRYNA